MPNRLRPFSRSFGGLHCSSVLMISCSFFPSLARSKWILKSLTEAIQYIKWKFVYFMRPSVVDIHNALQRRWRRIIWNGHFWHLSPNRWASQAQQCRCRRCFTILCCRQFDCHCVISDRSWLHIISGLFLPFYFVVWLFVRRRLYAVTTFSTVLCPCGICVRVFVCEIKRLLCCRSWDTAALTLARYLIHTLNMVSIRFSYRNRYGHSLKSLYFSILFLVRVVRVISLPTSPEP